MFTPDNKVKITKVEDSLRGLIFNGQVDPNPTHKFFLGYSTSGYLWETPKVGYKIRMNTDIKNGKQHKGYFASSVVEEIEEDNNKWIIHTKNSVYVMESAE